MAAAARDVIAIRFNMTCPLLMPALGRATPRESTHEVSVPFRAHQGNSRAHSACIPPWSEQAPNKSGPAGAGPLLYAYACACASGLGPALDWTTPDAAQRFVQ